jgi:hypothetical protein
MSSVVSPEIVTIQHDIGFSRAGSLFQNTFLSLSCTTGRSLFQGTFTGTASHIPSCIYSQIMFGPLVGKFADVVGLSYRSGILQGTTNSAGEFKYTENEQISFYIGTVYLGSTLGKPLVTILDCVAEKVVELTDPKLLNRARLLFSLTSGQGFEREIVIDDKVRATLTLLRLSRKRILDLNSILLSGTSRHFQICRRIGSRHAQCLRFGFRSFENWN